MTEFGRTVRENGSAGTDHGHAGAMLVLGGGGARRQGLRAVAGAGARAALRGARPRAGRPTSATSSPRSPSAISGWTGARRRCSPGPRGPPGGVPRGAAAGPALVADRHHGLDPAAHVPVRATTVTAAARRRDEVVENPVRHRLVESALVPVRPQVELKGFQLDARSGHVLDADRREVGLPGHRAEAGELGAVEPNRISRAGCGFGTARDICSAASASAPL